MQVTVDEHGILEITTDLGEPWQRFSCKLTREQAQWLIEALEDYLAE